MVLLSDRAGICHSAALLYPPEAKITALGAFAERARPLEFQARQTAVDPLIVFTEDPGQLRAPKFRKGPAVRTGGDIHTVFALLLRVEVF